jgi:hypothetical protein
MSRLLLCALAAAALLPAASCSRGRCCPAPAAPTTPAAAVAPAATPIPIRTSGVLGDYSGMRPGRHPGTWYRAKDGVDLRVYDNVLLEPLELRFAEGTVGAAATEEMCSKAKTCFLEILRARVAPYYPVLDEPQPHTIAVRMVLTEVDPAVAAREGVAAQVGGATIEGEFRDAVTGEVLVAFVSRIEGSTRGEVAKEEWKPVEGAFREWADRLLDFLDLYTK